jgi:hypothetical protein
VLIYQVRSRIAAIAYLRFSRKLAESILMDLDEDADLVKQGRFTPQIVAQKWAAFCGYEFLNSEVENGK